MPKVFGIVFMKTCNLKFFIYNEEDITNQKRNSINKIDSQFGNKNNSYPFLPPYSKTHGRCTKE